MATRINPNPVNFSIIQKECSGLEKPGQGVNQTNGSFTDAVGRIADIEALSGATKGLDLLNKTVKAGGPNVQRIVDGGANAVVSTVLSPVGISGETVFGTINKVQPSAVNNMVGAATAIHEKIQNDDFSEDDIPLYVRDFANVIKIGGRLFSSGQEREGQAVCQTKPYARDLANFGVKLNYRFLVQFEFNSPYDKSMGGLDHKFMIKTADRPQVQFEYEDVNMYNFKTKVLRKAVYQPINLTFYDDQLSQVLDFYKMYLRTISPIANTQDVTQADNYENTGMNFGNNSFVASGRRAELVNATYNYSASVGALLNNNKDIIRAVRLVHLYYGGAMMDVYTLYRPRVMEMQLDQLDMTSSAGNTMTINLSYDGMLVETFKRGVDKIDWINVGSGVDLLYPVERNLMTLNGINPESSYDEAVDALLDQMEPTKEGNLVDKVVSQGKGLLKKASDFVTGATNIF